MINDIHFIKSRSYALTAEAETSAKITTLAFSWSHLTIFIASSIFCSNFYIFDLKFCSRSQLWCPSGFSANAKSVQRSVTLSVTFKEHQKLSPAQTGNTHTQGLRQAAEHSTQNCPENPIVWSASRPPTQVTIKSVGLPSPAQATYTLPLENCPIPDPELVSWEGKTVNSEGFLALCYDHCTKVVHPTCLTRVLLGACQYMFLNLSLQDIINDLNHAPEIIRMICCPQAKNAWNQCINWLAAPQAVPKSANTSQLNRLLIGWKVFWQDPELKIC
ncbi:hypothetical protein VP01_148g5 [Puccinia sorghi]|uniref:Uncharacterized protein n=1 Tax=Puccinia sorghi TaxID=27349 RepID=A0A0L6VJE4_9BASI|nr:hypothetical protein VP01_148g5 [Puccinia sorghi]